MALNLTSSHRRWIFEVRSEEMKRQWRILSCYCYACYCKVGFHLPQSADAAAISKCIWLWQVKDNNEGWSDLIIIICLEVILIKASSNVCSQYHLHLLLWLSIVFSMSFIHHTVEVNNFAEQVIIFLLSKYVVWY